MWCVCVVYVVCVFCGVSVVWCVCVCDVCVWYLCCVVCLSDVCGVYVCGVCVVYVVCVLCVCVMCVLCVCVCVCVRIPAAGIGRDFSVNIGGIENSIYVSRFFCRFDLPPLSIHLPSSFPQTEPPPLSGTLLPTIHTCADLSVNPHLALCKSELCLVSLFQEFLSFTSPQR